eukprot:TRINITY_DN22520_c0_g1_i1.p1 TRINITY_DN22520_c0_g1~~TRINITY_DN22520_c0_g1_i1.p1  ORF type:complete len:533 (+),score=62.35 TRINITY_DN22520_c0_g1_i1:36-1601(+)
MVRLTFQRDFFIPIPLHTLHAVLVHNFEGRTSREFAAFARLAEAVCHQRAKVYSSEMRRAFLTLAPASCQGRRFDAVHSFTELQDCDIEELEDSFIDVLVRIVHMAHYKLVSHHEWETGMEENFNLASTIEVDWQRMDGSCFARWRKRLVTNDKIPQLEGVPFRHASRILVFHRGVGQVTLTSRFIVSKVNLLLTFLVEKTCCRRRSPCGGSENTAEDVGLHKYNEQCTNRMRVVVKRETLRHVLPSAAAVLWSLFSKTTIAEPVFKDIVTLHFQRQFPESEAHPRNGRAFPVLKCFHSIPMADIEVILPNKTVKLPPLECVQCVFGIVQVVLFVLDQTKSFGSRTMDMTQFACSFLLVLAFKILTVATKAKQKTERFLVQMSKSLYENSVGSDFAVVADLVNSMEEQNAKEILLAYWALLQSNRPMTYEAIARMLEDTLCKEFGTFVNVDLEHALHMLCADGLAREVICKGDQAGWECVRLKEALRRLRNIRHEHTDELADTGKPSSLNSFFSKRKVCLP